jgi:hypothetical protein
MIMAGALIIQAHKEHRKQTSIACKGLSVSPIRISKTVNVTGSMQITNKMILLDLVRFVWNTERSPKNMPDKPEVITKFKRRIDQAK